MVTVEADGPLPQPGVGQLAGPPRVYLDLAGVRAQALRAEGISNGSVAGVRVGQHSVRPLVTRVVIDLTRLEPFRIDVSDRRTGVMKILLGSGDMAGPKPSASLEPVAPIPTTGTPVERPRPAPAAREPVAVPPTSNRGPERPADPPVEPRWPVGAETPDPSEPDSNAQLASKVPRRDLERYRRQTADPLARVMFLRPRLYAVDLGGDETNEVLQMMADEFAALRSQLAGVIPPEPLRPSHELVIRACTLGAMAANLRLQFAAAGDLSALSNSRSAAAGALLLLDQACADLSCPQASQR